MIGILEAFTGRHMGTALFKKLDGWAREHDIHRLELSAMVHNTRAAAPYQKMGFEIEGTKRDSLFVDGAYVDEYYMGKILEEPHPAVGKIKPK